MFNVRKDPYELNRTSSVYTAYERFLNKYSKERKKEFEKKREKEKIDKNFIKNTHIDDILFG